jgi:hypothetical protein
MQKNKKYSAVAISLLLASVSALSLIFTSCVPFDINTGIDDSIIVISKDPVSKDTSIEVSIPTEEGSTEAPSIKDIKNIAPDVVVIAGTCEKDAVVTIKGGKEEVTAKSKDGYFIAEVTLANDSTTILEAIAEVEGKKESKPRTLTAGYNATVEKREGGNNVSVGNGSQLYFDYNLEDYIGENLLTQTELRTIRNYVNDKVNSLESRAIGQKTGLIYVLVPDFTSIYPEYLPEDTENETGATRYKQVVDTLKETSATVIDMYDIFNKNKDKAIYRSTDSRLTEYGSYLVYEQICKQLSVNFPKAAARSLDEFDKKEVKNVIAGDLFKRLGLATEHYTETITDLVPKFDLKIGYEKDSSFNTVNISDIKKYAAENDYTPYEVKSTDSTSKSDNTVAINDRFIVRTGREDLPSALIYRDDATFSMIDILAERFNNAMFARSGDFTVNLTDASRHYSKDKSLVDYIIVILSEGNVQKITG